MSMSVFIATPDGDRKCLDVGVDECVGDLRMKVAETIGVKDVGSVGLSLGGAVLDDDEEMIADVGIDAEGVIDIWDKWIDAVGGVGGSWVDCHPGLLVENNRVTVADPHILSFNALWSRPIRLSSCTSTIHVALTLSSTRPMDHRHMVGLVPLASYRPTGYLDTSSHGSIAYEISGLLITGGKVHQTLPLATCGPVSVELFINCSSRTITVHVSGEPVISNALTPYWPDADMYPFVTLNTLHDYAEPMCYKAWVRD
eukprot:TRINITY_DN5000_c0_g1_i1.p1 TRINITY_DN5000_c0_g1~~TRINITY_DN5000_c0_g1_i1.p1  ORF type:complete len:256 (+),score=8.82 TRINITY_DN5000_c0_g1_i1:289-1056(+)